MNNPEAIRTPIVGEVVEYHNFLGKVYRGTVIDVCKNKVEFQTSAYETVTVPRKQFNRIIYVAK